MVTTPRARAIAVAFMRKPPTEQEQIARDLLVFRDGLPERTNEAALEILRRVAATDQVDALARRVGIKDDDA